MTEPTAPHRRRAVVLGGCAALVAVLAAGTVLWLTRSDPAPTSVARATHTTTSPARAPTSPPAAKPAPTRTRTEPPVPHDVVAAAAPSSFTYTAPRYTIKAHVCGMQYVRPLDPPGEQHHTVCWVQHDFGFAPGSHGHGTTYVLGHSWGQDPLEVLNKVSETAMRQVLPAISHGRRRFVDGIGTYPITRLDGDVITLRTSSGVLEYTVRNAYAVAKAEAGSITSLMDQRTRNRVVIITCAELNHTDYEYNIIVSAYLTSSRATSART